MNDPALWDKALEELTKYLTPDEDGLRMLTCQLNAAY